MDVLLCVFALSLQVTWAVDKVILLNPPEEPVSHHFLDLLYSCDEPATVNLDCVVSFETGSISSIPLKRWSCIPGDPKIKTLELELPDWLVYQADGIIPETHWVLSCILLASLRGFDESVAARDVAILEPKPFFSRPLKQHQLCVSWGKKILQISQEFWKKQCPIEQETVPLLSSLYASTGESFGITKSLDPHGDEVLEYLRLKAISYPWCMFSIWIFLTSHCQGALCGLLYHIDSNNDYITPTLLLKKSGHIHIQMDGESEGSSAFVSMFKVPLNEWCQISVRLLGRMVTVSMVCINKEQRTVHSADRLFGHTVVLDDTQGYFVVGGGKFVRGVEGYFGPVVYHRNRIPAHSTSEVALPDVIRTVNLSGWLQSCEAFHLDMAVKLRGFSLQAQRTQSDACFDVFHEWMLQDRQTSKSQCALWEATLPHRRRAAKLTKLLAFKHGGRGVSVPAVGRALYSASLHQLSRASSAAAVSTTLPLLLQAGCLAHGPALHLASVLYGSGLGVKEQPEKAWLLALLAAHKDERLALLRLGHLHHQGLHGLPADPDLAYAYYSNIAQQTTLDRHKPSPQQTFVEAVFLNNEEQLSLQTREDHHLFQWLKLQAGRGAAEAERVVARMLFWGQQGVSPDIQTAAKHYERGAVRLEDPVSMYDYGIVLLLGHGVQKDVPRALTFLKKAMEKDFVPAINALAWYYERFEQDYVQAVRLWEQADSLGCPEAPVNLGVMHSGGLYPGRAADQFTAYKYYLKAAQRGHMRAGVLLASFLITGIPGRISRRPSEALLWAKWTAEHNGYLGRVLRTGLDSYLRRDMFRSLLYYTMAAESGYSPAQFNAAYLCDQNMLSFLDPAFASNCTWRYYNLTIQSQNPDTYALIRMGDLLYEQRRDFLSAAEMYTLAALQKDPQGWYSLGLLAEDGFRLPLSLLIHLDLSELYLADSTLLKSTLYRRCRDSDDKDSYLPCSLALFNVYLQSIQKDYRAAVKFSVAVAVVTASTVFLIIMGVLRRHVPSAN